MKKITLQFVCILVFLFVDVISLAQDGTPDLSFGNNGVIVTPLNEGDSYIVGLNQGPNDRIIVQGRNYDFNQNMDFNFMIAYLQDGTIDETFGNNGSLWSDGANEYYRGVKILDNNKILVKSNINIDYTITRLFPDGTLDVSFGNNGQLQPFTAGVSGRSMRVDSENNLLVLGTALNSGDSSIVLTKYSEDGIPDTSFGVDGIISHSIGNVTDLRTSTFKESGSHLFIGVSYSENETKFNSIIKLFLDGSLDTSFGVNGIAVLPISEPYSAFFSVLENGSFLVGASYYDEDEYTVVRKTIKLFSDATPDLNFGTNGVLDNFAGGRIQDNQRFVSSSSYGDFEGGISLSYSRFFQNGSLDNSFDFSSNYGELGSVSSTELNDGKILIVGTDIWYNGPEINLVLQRFNNNPLSMEDNQLRNLKLYPNPSNGVFTLKGLQLQASETPYQISDISGKLIQKGTLTGTETTIDLSQAQSGIYFLFTAGQSMKLIKQ